MSGRHSVRPDPGTRFEFEDRKRSVSAQHTPRQNRLLATLPVQDYERLLANLELVPLPLGWTIHGAGDREKYLYFLTGGIVSRFHVTESGASAEFAITGNEGMIGVASFLGGESTPSQAVVLSAGYSYRLATDVLKKEFEHDGPLPHLLLRYAQALIVQIGQIAVCNRHHSLQQRLCRWILSCLDRLPSNELTITQELIADRLGVRRVGVTRAAGKLNEAGLIRSSRGHIEVLDRPQLEAQACECYAVVKRAYDRLTRPRATAGNAGVHGTYGHCRAHLGEEDLANAAST
jgi:CRP-like cAMP-binding protein